MPACMLATVFLPITFSGFISSNRGSFAVRSVSASADSLRPGQIAPPRNSPFADTAPNDVAVPKSMVMHGPPYSS